MGTLLLGGLGLVAILGAAATAGAGVVTPPPVPDNLEVPGGHKAFRMAHAIGTQNYICLTAGQPWTFIGPQATVFDDDGEQLLGHYLSPNPVEGGIARATWQHSKDTSTVWALAIASSSDPDFVAPGAVPWLLLQTAGTQEGPNGGAKMTVTTFIQRVNTVGGPAPQGVCPAAGTRAFVPYEADYVFYKSR
jgi:hypothetical protein